MQETQSARVAQPSRSKSWLAWCGAPAAWVVHWLPGYALASALCPGRSNVPVARHFALDGSFLLVTGIALALMVAGVQAAWSGWRRSRCAAEAKERVRFAATCALLCSGLFAVALLFSIANLVVAPLCG